MRGLLGGGINRERETSDNDWHHREDLKRAHGDGTLVKA